MLTRIATGLAVSVLLIALPSLALGGGTPQQKCAAAKRKLAGKKIAGAARCVAKAIGKGTALGDPSVTDCLAKNSGKFSTAWGKAEAKGACATTGDETTIESKVDSHLMDLETALGTNGPSKCTAAEMKAAGKKGACRLRCMGKAARKGLEPGAPTVVACLGACSAKFDTAYAKGVAKGDCDTGANAMTVEDEVDSFVDDVANELPFTYPSTTTNTNTTTTTTMTIRTGSFTCTEVLGFSQTGMWYLDVANGGGGTFEPLVGDGFWQLRAGAGAGVSWQDPNFAGWTSTPYSPCAQNSTNPDRVLLTISTPSGVPTLDWWVTNIRAEIATIRTKYSNLREIILQPVVGGPNDGVCNFGGNPADPVHASVIHPTIDQAIAQVVGGDVIAGMSPEVRTCADYVDNTGHLRVDARPAIGTLIGRFYAAF